MSGRSNKRRGSAKKRIVLVDDHPIFREGLAELINQQDDLEVCALCGSAKEAVDTVQTVEPDMVVTDVGLPGANGIELIKNLKSMRPAMPVLALSLHDERLYAERALRAGASGYISKQTPVKEVLAAVREVLKGQRYLSPAMQQRLMELMTLGKDSLAKPILDLLSDREMEVFEQIAAGLSTRDIAKKLNLSAKTVETYRGNIREKLGLRTGADVLRAAVEYGGSRRSV